MAVEIAPINPLGVTGLDNALTETIASRTTNPAPDFQTLQVLISTCYRYNDLPYISSRESHMERDLKLIQKAIILIASHGIDKNFRPHIAHCHDFIDNRTIRFETEIEGTPFKITKPTNIKHVDSINMHPTCFKVIRNDLVPFKFTEGPTPLNASKIPTKFI